MEPVEHLRIAHGFPKQQMVVLPRPVVREALGKPVTAALLPTDIGQFLSASSHYIERRVGLSQAILIYCVRGEGWAEITGDRFVVREDSVLIVPPGLPHMYGAAEHRPWTIYWCHVAGNSVRPLLEALGGRADRPLVVGADPRTLVPLFEQILGTLQGGYSQTSLLVASLTMGHLIGHLIVQRGGGKALGDINERLEATIEFMKQQVGASVNVNELAAMAKLSPSHYAVLFKRKTGYSVLDYFIRLKMQEACRLLDMTALPIKAIADRLAYQDPLYFSRAFHKVMAVPPRAYRAMHKG